MKIKHINRINKWARKMKSLFVCSNCGEATRDGHYCPPALGDEGFFVCEKKIDVSESAPQTERK